MYTNTHLKCVFMTFILYARIIKHLIGVNNLHIYFSINTSGSQIGFIDWIVAGTEQCKAITENWREKNSFTKKSQNGHSCHEMRSTVVKVN